MKSAGELDKSIKSLRQWLIDTEVLVISPVVYQIANNDEIQRQLSEQQVSVDSNFV